MKSFFKLVYILILSITVGTLILGMYLTSFFEWSSISGYLFFTLLGIMEFISISFLIKRFYEAPVIHLEYTIKKFLVGSLKDKDIQFARTSNPHLNYILLFFSKTLNTLKNIKWEFIHGKEIKSEVDLAREIQEKLLLKKIKDIPSLNIVAKSKSAKEIGGDSYDVIKQWENYYIYVWDATGHGVGAGFIMMMVNALVHAYCKVTVKWNNILAYTNDSIKPRVKANLLMSMLLLRWNEDEKKLYMTGAWHEYLMIYKFEQKKCFKIKSGGVALWMTKNIHKLLKERRVSFEKNDIVVLYSDGITESINLPEKNGEERMFGEDRLMEVIESAPEMPGKWYKTAKSVFKNISVELSKFMGYKHTQLDDITLAVIQYKPDDYDITKDYSESLPKELVTEWNWDN